MATTSYRLRNIFGHEKIREEYITVDAADVDTDSSGNVSITFPHLRKIIEASVQASIEAGYAANVISVSGNTVTLRIYQGDYDQTADAPLAAVASGTDLGILHVRAIGW